ncbi:hypothetical protein EV182_001416 [Spiromyces aspiralis]|uniref:Uncharacterized protein n=1 Tax=Spiromyces aspiralis TaxID=68401 RepID=A0ACC1HVH4_9FUNG|nr:hypothetical protein EV182_001416 [Spiromyces aspiralis]
MKFCSIAALAALVFTATTSFASPVDSANAAAAANLDKLAVVRKDINTDVDVLKSLANSIGNSVDEGDGDKIDNVLSDLLNNVFVLNDILNDILNIGILDGVNGAGSGSV